MVDNGSTDPSSEYAKSSGAEVIRFEENRGFAIAVNEGIRQANSDFVLIVNNDVVLSHRWIENALRVGKEEDAPFVCGKLLRPSQASGTAEIDGSWDLISRAAYAWRCGYGKPDGPVWSQRRRIHWAPMTAAMFHRRVFEQVGLLDTRFESYYEDVEFGVRCAAAGIAGIYDPEIVATHMSKTTLGKGSGRVYFYTARNQVYILALHFPAATLRRFAWAIFVGQTLSLCAAAKQRNFLAALRGKWAALRDWRRLRRSPPAAAESTIERIFTESERDIARLQQQSGFDIYWKIYFALVKA